MSHNSLTAIIIILMPVFCFSTVHGQDGAWNITVNPARLLLRQGETGDVKIRFEMSWANYNCSLDCDGVKVPKSNFKRNRDSLHRHFCKTSLAAVDNNTRNCSWEIIAIYDVKTGVEEKFYEYFVVEKPIEVVSQPVIAWKGRDANLGKVYDTYTEPITCMYERFETRYHQENCIMEIHKTEINDAGIHNFSICLTDYPDGCVTGNKEVYVLTSERNTSALTITVNGNNPRETLIMQCSKGCTDADPSVHDIDDDGQFHYTWENVTGAPLIQVLEADTMNVLFNGTVIRTAKKEAKHHGDNGMIALVILLAVPCVGGVAVFIWLYYKSKFCFQQNNGNRNQSGTAEEVPLNVTIGSNDKQMEQME